MKTTSTTYAAPAGAPNIVELRNEAWGDVRDNFEKFCLTCGLDVLQGMMEENVAELAGERHERASGKPGYRWGSTVTRLDFHEGKVPHNRPRVRDKITGKEIPLATWEQYSNGEKLREWAVNLMVMNVATRKFGDMAGLALRDPARARLEYREDLLAVRYLLALQNAALDLVHQDPGAADEVLEFPDLPIGCPGTLLSPARPPESCRRRDTISRDRGSRIFPCGPD